MFYNYIYCKRLFYFMWNSAPYIKLLYFSLSSHPHFVLASILRILRRYLIRKYNFPQKKIVK